MSDWNREQSEGERVQREWTKERLYTRAEVEALLAAQREACTESICHRPEPIGCLCERVRATPLVEITTNKDKT